MGQLLTASVMAVKMGNTRLIPGLAVRLARIVEQSRQPQHHVRPHSSHRTGCMMPAVGVMMRVVLVKVKQRLYLRQDNRKYIPELQHQAGAARADKEFLHLSKNTLRRDLVQILTAAMNGFRCSGFDLKVKPARKAQRPQNAKGILREPLFRLPYRPNQTVFQIFTPVIQVNEAKF